MQQLHGRGGVVVDGADDDEPGLMVAADPERLIIVVSLPATDERGLAVIPIPRRGEEGTGPFGAVRSSSARGTLRLHHLPPQSRSPRDAGTRCPSTIAARAASEWPFSPKRPWIRSLTWRLMTRRNYRLKIGLIHVIQICNFTVVEEQCVVMRMGGASWIRT
ncbi:hypothetical protein PVAP13_1KG116754 [Panicum virgatum]|uniref:Uncharacterized protein n=1 Tax=Panicum virgatum TaxID=38727 RepID=A0A8T0XNN7_PANVG|nr:hypothetical protein PVAP13_1KG116754 [Panicum virgatum]